MDLLETKSYKLHSRMCFSATTFQGVVVYGGIVNIIILLTMGLLIVDYLKLNEPCCSYFMPNEFQEDINCGPTRRGSINFCNGHVEIKGGERTFLTSHIYTCTHSYVKTSFS